MKTVIGITGTTSVGKSAVAVNLAQMLNTEVISADSMQIYKGMNIGTAKIMPEEMRGIRHYMLDIAEPCENYSSYLYQESASRIIESIPSVPIVVGGSGFYFDSLVYPPEFGNCDHVTAANLRKTLSENGIEALCEMLRDLDKDTYNSIDLNNPKRVLRAVEIAMIGRIKSQGKGKTTAPRYDLKLFVLQRNRAELYKHIDERVDKMMANGLVDEVSALVEKYGICDTSAFSAIGYKEVIEYLQGRLSLHECVEKIKLNTRHYAKRQITYYKKMNVYEYVDVDERSTDEIAEYVYDKCKEFVK